MGPGTQFTFFTGTKVQTLTPEELRASLRTSLGFVEAKTVAEHAANDRVDAAVGETLEPLLNGIEAAAKTSASEAAFTSAVNKLVLDYFGKSSLGSRNTLSARRRDLDEQVPNLLLK